MSDPRVAIVTGSADGIGKAIALRLAADGCNVVVNDLPHQSERLNDVVRQVDALGRKAISFIGDITIEEDVRRLVEHAIDTFGSLDIMVANAEIALLRPFVETTCEDFDRTISVNLRGAFLSYKYAAIQMIKQGRGGRIIGASSIGGKRGVEGFGAYSASKFGIRGLTQSAAQEWGVHGITVNAYCPGSIWTPMTRSIVPDDNTFRKHMEMWAERVAVRRSGQPHDITGLVSFLASEESSFITGQSITVDGGFIFD